MKILLPILLALASPIAFGDDQGFHALVKRGDEEDRQGRTRAALSCFRAAEQLDPKNPGVLLRISKQYSDLLAQTKSAPAAEMLARRSRDYAERAIQLDPKSAKAHLSLAISYGKLTDFVGAKTKLEYSKIIKEETLKSIELDANDDYAWHVLGRWNAGVAKVNGMLKTMAKLVYGGLPAASNEEAARCLKKATELAPQRIMHHSELARVYKALDKTDLAAKEWQAVLSIPAADQEDEKEKREAREALRIPAAGPSR